MPRRTSHRSLALARVRAVVAALTLSSSVSLERAAAQLGTSPRTLQRRLCAAGTRFGKIVEQTRLGIAGALLRKTELSVQEIAGRMGYSTSSGFARAFGRWSGQSPSAYRNLPRAPDENLARNGQNGCPRDISLTATKNAPGSDEP